MTLQGLPPIWPEELLPRIRDEIARSKRRLVLLDDDPTGTQTTHGVLVVTDWSEGDLTAGLRANTPVLFVLTNSRSLPESEAVSVAREAGQNLAKAARAVGVQVSVGYRADSTLRGHYPAELWALRDAFAAEDGRPFDGEVIAPFFAEGGRYTVDDVHLVRQGEDLVPAGETEFARDAAFGYRSSHLPTWVEEKSSGVVSAAAAISLSIDMLRTGGPHGVAEVLERVEDGAPVIMNAADDRDLEVFVLGLLWAEAQGKRFIYRTAASFARVRAGLPVRPPLTPRELYAAHRPGNGRGGLTIVGSHVRRTTEQLEQALKLPRLHGRELLLRRVLDPATREAELEEIISWTERRHSSGDDVLVYTSRDVVAGGGAEESLRISQSISAALVDIAGRLTVSPRYVIAKGGITANDVAKRAFGVQRAWVPGQVAPGVPCWILGPESRFPGVPYVIFPGNVGDAGALADVIAALRRNE